MPTKKQKNTSPDSPLFADYRKRVESGAIQDDAAQREVLQALEAFGAQIESNALAKLFHKQSIAGIYIWGNVGRGKSMLMDLFFTHVRAEKKKRVHFHAFMQDVHARLHQIRQDGAARDKSGMDPVMELARQLSEESTLLCFDELQATDVADATLLYRLFSGLFERGVAIVSTSNHPPASLYTGGVQRERFDRFVALIESRMKVIALTSPLDYRQTKMHALEKRYFWPLGVDAENFVTNALAQLCADPRPHKKTIQVQGRALAFAIYDNSIGRFTFKELCEKPLAAADYLAIAKHCDTIILTGIPQLSATQRNEAKRFVTLIDALYESKVKLLCTANAPPEQLYATGDGAFEFQRTASRLAEMQSAEWGHK